MRLKLTTDCAGEVRLSLLEDLAKPRVSAPIAADSLVCSSFLQEGIYKNSTSQKAGYGRALDKRNFTSLAKRRLREFGALIDQGALENVVFLTGTLPGSTPAAMGAVAQWSSWVVSRLAQWFRDRFPGCLYFGVWEFQRRGALHLHVCVRTANSTEARKLKQSWKRRWLGLLDGVENRSGVDIFEKQKGGSWKFSRWIVRTDAQTVVKSVARYLSKYTSKGSVKARNAQVFSPARWWFASQTLSKTAAEQRTIIHVSKLTLSHATSLFESIAAKLVESTSKSYPVFSIFDARFKGLISLAPPAVVGVLMRELKFLLSACVPDTPLSSEAYRNRWNDICSIFGGKILNSC